MCPSELGRGGSDGHGEHDRPNESSEVLRPRYGRDYVANPLTPAEIELENKAARGELRWNSREHAWVESEPYDWVKRRDLAARMRTEVELPEKVQDAPYARDLLPNIHWAEIDRRKFETYSLNPDHPQNRGKADGWRKLGYEVDDPEARRQAAQELKDLVHHELLTDGKLVQADETPHGRRHQVLNGFIGPNGRHGTLVTCWLVADQSDRGYPRLTTTWMMPHKEKETDR